MDDDDVLPSPPVTTPSVRPSFQTMPSSQPVREDCWSEAATFTLIEAWGDRHVELNRGNLRQKHWQEVADAVNNRHGHVKKARRTDTQCKNRIDTLKKKYKIEKSKFLELKGNYTSPWPFFASLDSLIGTSFKPSPQQALTTYRKPVPSPLPLPPPMPLFPVGLRSKRPAPASNFRRNFSAMAAAAAKVEEEEEEEEESDTSGSSGESNRRRVIERENEKDLDGGAEAYRGLAEAIAKFGEIYERVEEAKQRQLVELEKQRMQFTKDLELQRMKLFMESQVQLEKLKRSKRSSEPDFYRCNDGEHSASVS